MSEIKKLTFEEWQKEYGLPTVIEHNTDWVLTQKQRDMCEESWKKQEQERYELYCKKVEALNTDPHSNITYVEAVAAARTDVLNTINKIKNIDAEVTKDQMWSVMKKLEQVEEKNRCLKVRILDWMSDKFTEWAARCHRASVNIDSPCVIRLPAPTPSPSSEPPFLEILGLSKKQRADKGISNK